MPYVRRGSRGSELLRPAVMRTPAQSSRMLSVHDVLQQQLQEQPLPGRAVSAACVIAWAGAAPWYLSSVHARRHALRVRGACGRRRQ